MLRARPLGHLLAGAVGDHALERAVKQLLHERQGTAWRVGQHHHARGALHDTRRHGIVGQTHALGAPCVNRLARQHHIHGGSGADAFGQTQHAAPTWENAEHDFRQAHLGTRLLNCQQVAARERQFEATGFGNQFVAPLVVALLLSKRGASGPGVELFVMIAGVVTTMSFLLLQARVARRALPSGDPRAA